MLWTIEYFEQEDGTQPAEIFEDNLFSTNKKGLGKLLRLIELLGQYGPHLGGGYLEKCHSYEGLWEIRIISSKQLIRELCGFDEERIILLHGYVKSQGQPASMRDLEKAYHYWTQYLKNRLVSPVQEENHE